MNKKELLNAFGKLLVTSVRDEVLDINNLILSGKMGGEENQEFYSKVKGLEKTEIEIIKQFAKRTVDSTLHYFLWMIEQNEEFDLIAHIKDKEQFISLRDISDGLYGELYTEYGWIEKYSKYPPSIT